MVVPEFPQSTTPRRLGERVDAAAVDGDGGPGDGAGDTEVGERASRAGHVVATGEAR